MNVRGVLSAVALTLLAAAFSACTVSDALDAAPVRAVSDAAAQKVTKAGQAAADATRQLSIAVDSPQASTRARGSAGTPAPAKTAPPRAASASPATVASRVTADEGLSVEPSAAMTKAEPLHDSRPVLGAAQAGYMAAVPSLRGLSAGDHIYSEADQEVTPAVLLTTQHGGPVFQGVHGSVNTMELVVSREGRVETVKLLTPAIRMTDMLLLSGAKTWKFAPALKDGQPVRYRTRFSWESTP